MGDFLFLKVSIFIKPMYGPKMIMRDDIAIAILCTHFLVLLMFI